ncbi:BfmA/BtgA family mobilization protein [Arenibacter sp. S6351L]|uniref:BfmA/BtgA family mobilization protein n=1 Tax=Arenibacter sp. S6351L TaxID=2926407 RepID=UPI001FF1E302|nr:BfmA/BtgA family mobilization protein [Arenibacter sp. S6351L]MCK0135306.1 hypothetical protein [Arenibacter sp. S6351L]
MDHFYTIRFKKNTAQRFKRFSKKIGVTYSESMEMIIDFFEWHGFLPSDKFEKSVGKEVLKNRKRTEAAIAIIRDIEKNQTKPTTAMLQLLFEHSPQKKQGQPPLLMDGRKVDPERDMFFKKVEAAIAMEKDFTNIKLDFKELRTDFLNLLDRVELVKGTFGKPRLQLDMTPEDFQKLKIKMEKQ